MDERPPDIVIVAGGRAVDRSTASALARTRVEVIAADSGVDVAHRAGLGVQLAIGDFDSVSESGLARVEREGGEVRRHPADKDATDLELALDVALERAPARVMVLGTGGGRFDHHMANLFLVAAEKYAPLEIEVHDGESVTRVVRGEVAIGAPPGALVTILPVGGPATVSTKGLRWSLDHDVLVPGTTRGVSNLSTSAAPVVRVHEGAALVITPERRSTSPTPGVP